MAARAAAAALVTVSHRPRGVAVLTLNNAPQLNALSVALGDTFRERVHELRRTCAAVRRGGGGGGGGTR